MLQYRYSGILIVVRCFFETALTMLGVTKEVVSMEDIWDILLGIALVIFMVNLIWGVR
jgi:hypothetical protein